MESIKIDRVLELIVDRIITEDKKMHSLKEKMQLFEKIKAKAFYDDRLRVITCAANKSSTTESMPVYNFLLLERIFAEDDEDVENSANENDLYGWMLWCFNSLDELKQWFRKGVEEHLDIAYIDSVYAFDSWTYREVPVRYFLTVEGEKHYISTLDFWEEDDEEIYRTLDIELAGVAEAHCSAGTRCHIGFTLADIYNSIIFNELADFTHPTADTLDAGYFFYEGEKHYFLLHTKEGHGWIDFVTPECKRVEMDKGFWRPKNKTEDEVLKSLQN